MAQGIDFLKAEREKNLVKAKMSRSLKLGGFIFLLVYCLVTAAIFAYWLKLDQANRKLNQEIDFKKQRIQELKKVESLQIFLKQRLTTLTKIISGKSLNYSQVITYLEEISPDGLVLSGINFNEKGEIAISGEAINILVLSDFLEVLKEKQPVDTDIPEIVLSSMSRKEDGTYGFSFTIKTDEKSGSASST